MKAPCKDCADRTMLCHGICPKYAAYVAENNRAKAARASDPHRLVYDYQFAQANKIRAATVRR